jgi:hypothetical protein
MATCFACIRRAAGNAPNTDPPADADPSNIRRITVTFSIIRDR